jgi:3-isopropylmalate dehydrogenase
MTLVHTQAKCLAKKGFELAMTRTKKLCCVDKANVLETCFMERDRTGNGERLSKVEAAICLMLAKSMATTS